MSGTTARMAAAAVALVAVVGIALALRDDDPEATVTADDVTTTVGSATTAADVTADTTEAPTTTVTVGGAIEAAPVSVVDGPDDAPGTADGFVVDIEVGQIGDSFLRYRFEPEEATAYTIVVVDADGEVVSTGEGSAKDGVMEADRVDGLEPGTDYTARVTLIGPPAAESSELAFRTTGQAPDPEADAATEQVAFVDVEVTSLRHHEVDVHYQSNVCANGSFVVIEQATGDEFGRNDGFTEGCTTRLQGVPGRWTANELEPETTYVILFTIEANGMGRGRPYGNIATHTLVVTTPPRPIPADPADRSVPQVEFTSVQQAETSESSVRIDFQTNVCSHASFVVREIGGAEVGRHDGSPRGCATDHSAIPGLWTSALRPDTDYLVVLTVEADGPGAGDGNVATESIPVRTAPPLPDPDSITGVEIADLEVELDGDTITVSFSTEVCAVGVVTLVDRVGGSTVDVGEDECSTEHRWTGLPTSTDGETVVVVTATDPATDPRLQDRDTEVVLVGGP